MRPRASDRAAGRRRTATRSVAAAMRPAPCGARSGARGAEGIGLRVGDDVTHEKFGEGVIIELIGDGDKTEAVVNFRDVGEKRLLLAWAPLHEGRRLTGAELLSPGARRARVAQVDEQRSPLLAPARVDRRCLGSGRGRCCGAVVVVAVDERVDAVPAT